MPGPSVTWTRTDITTGGYRSIVDHGQLAGDPVIRQASLQPDRVADLYQSPERLPNDVYGGDLSETLTRWSYLYWGGLPGDSVDCAYQYFTPTRVTDPGSLGFFTLTNYVPATSTVYGWSIFGWVSHYVMAPPSNIGDYFYPAPDGLLLEGGAIDWYDPSNLDLPEAYAVMQGSPPAHGNWEPVWNIRTPFTNDRYFPQRRWSQAGKHYWQGASGYSIEAGSPGKFYDQPGSAYSRPAMEADDGIFPSRRHASAGIYSTQQGLPPFVECSGTATLFGTSAPAPIDYALMRKVLKADLTYDTIEVGRVTQAFVLEVAGTPNRYNAKLMPTSSIGVGPALADDDLTFEYILYSTDEGEPDPISNGGTFGNTAWHKIPCDYLRRACSRPLLGGAGTVPGWMRLIPPQAP